MKYTEQLEHESEETRLRLANTIEELRERLTPGQVLDEVLDYASDNDVGDYLRNFRRQVVDNPLPLGLMGMSIAWLVVASALGRRSSATAATAHTMADRASDRASNMAERASTMGERMRGIGDGAADVAGDLAARAQAAADNAAARASDVAGQAGELAGRAGDRMREAAGSAGATIAAASNGAIDSASRGARAFGASVSGMGRGTREAGRAIADFGREQPLILAATGLMIGAVIGALLPKTEAEDRLIGETSDAAKEKLRELAGEQYGKAKDIAAQTVEAALAASETGEAEDAAHRGAPDNAQQQERPAEFGPGPHGSGDHSSTEEAERARADGA